MKDQKSFALFTGFIGTTASSDFSRSFIIALFLGEGLPMRAAVDAPRPNVRSPSFCHPAPGRGALDERTPIRRAASRGGLKPARGLRPPPAPPLSPWPGATTWASATPQLGRGAGLQTTLGPM